MGEKIMGSSTETKERNPGLTGVVFSWSIDDIMNKDLYRNKVDQIQDTFSSVNYYLNSFVKPLIEETHADLRSSMTTLNSAPLRVVRLTQGDGFEPPNKLFYEFTLEDFEETSEVYEPEVGDLIAITEVRPKCIDDLNGCKISYTVALVKGISEEFPYWITIESSNLIFIEKAYCQEFDGGESGKLSHPLFAVYLTNLTTNQRIWRALHPIEGGNVDFLNTVLRINPSLEENCDLCSQRVETSDISKSTELIMSLGLDDSQRDAVLKGIAIKECNHRNSVKLIWGPPGTGKTKTIASLLFSLFRMKCKALTCAPTNVAVLGVAKRLMSYLNGTQLEFNTYGLGDVLLSGNGKRMTITEHEDLLDVFLDYRVSALLYCFFPDSGWKGRVKEMIRLLMDPETQYLRYLEKLKDKDIESESEDGNAENGSLKEKGAKGLLRKLVIENKNKNKKKYTKEKVNSQGRGKSKRDVDEGSKSKDVESESESEDGNVGNGSLKERVKRDFLRKLVTENKKKNKKKNTKEKVKSQERGKSKCDGGGESKNKDSEANNEGIVPWTFEEYFANNVFKIREQIALCTELLCSHMPTSCLPLLKLGKMIRAVDMLQTLENFLRGNKWSKESLIGKASNLYEIRIKSLSMLNLISAIEVPDSYERSEVRNFCLIHACLSFCTVSSSSKFHTLAREPFELVIIDEAAQVKECESSIPLQLPGLRHAILVGDEKQLPAMVMSEICKKARFGRSLFERLVTLGHSKHLLNVQYRMHPSISLFPNKEFYGNQIRNGLNVTQRGNERQFLKEKVFGSYSFINITNGKEDCDSRGTSKKNTVEAAVVAEIVSKLYKESMKSKEKVRVGCISPYKAQVFAIQESLGKAYSSSAKKKFSVNVRSVDGFQGGEEDIIIISTVRCNGNGSVGFLDDLQRANVALTRAKHCLWILGNAATLQNSATVWQRLVVDAKNRGCFHNAYEDDNLSRAISNALIDVGQQRSLFTADSILFKAAKWKVCFSGEFNESITRYRDSETQKEAASLLEKLSSGWRKQCRDEAGIPVEGVSSQLLEWDVVKGPLRLVWTIDIVREKSTDTQVLKVLDILPVSEVAEVAKKIEVLAGDYTMNQMTRCLYKRSEGGLMLPMSWPVDRSNSRSTYSTNDLATQLAATTLRNDPSSPRTRNTTKWRN